MLRIVQSANSSGAARYYTDGLKKADYYTKGAEIQGKWHGLTLEKLGLAAGGVETEKQFTALLSNRHPISGAKLTPRMNADQKRTPGWDFVFSLPKSVSLLQAVTGDAEIVRVFRESVVATMVEVEKRAVTRVRTRGRQEDRVSGNMVWAEFLHTTTRPLADGIPDPHLHIHAYVFNLTHDAVEDRFKAAKIRAIKDNAYLHEAYFDSVLAKKLVVLGYSIERTAKGWELAGMGDRKLIDKFSRRTVEIDRLADELGITDQKVKDKLGAASRNKKSDSLSQAELVKAWRSRLTSDEKAAVLRTHARNQSSAVEKVTVGAALNFAEAKLFQNQSVVAKDRIVAAALKFGVGSVTAAGITRKMGRRGFIEREIDGEVKVTTPALIVEEAMMIQRVRDGRGQLAPLLGGRLKFIQDFLSKEQREAARHILKSHDQVIALRGVAGSGKTTLLTEVRQQLEREGIRIVALAPSATASRGVLRDSGFSGAETITKFLASKELQKKARGHVLLIDEAGTIPNREFQRLLDIAGENTRIILSGDTGQHAPVGRGDCMRLLENYAGLPVATVRQIRRQETDGYRKAVEAMADRDLKTAFARLDEINAIVEIADDAARYRKVALDYAQCLTETGVPPLIVSPTHAEAGMAIGSVRKHLQELGRLGADRRFVQFRQFKWEEVEKLRAENYEVGQMVQFHQNVPGIKRGSILPVVDVDVGKTVWVESPSGKRLALDLSRAEHFRVFEIGEVAFAPGDRIKITYGGKDTNGRRLENGTVGTVKSIAKDGKVTLANGLLLNPDFGHWTYAYDTSHSSQGKTSPEVFDVQSSRSFRAGSMEQFYVSISRGKERVRIYTDDRVSLQNAVGNSSRRMSALELSGLGDELFIMNGGLSGKEWVKRIAEGKAWRQGQFKGHVEKLAAQRKIDPPQGKIASFVDYLEMRRANLSADGKSRSKGHPNLSKSGRRSQKGMVPDPRGNGKSEKPAELKVDRHAGKSVEAKAERVTRKPEKTEKKSSMLKHVREAVRASGRHLNEVVGRTKRGAETIKEGAQRAMKFGNLKTTLGKIAGNQKTKHAQIRQQAEKKPAAPKPKPPTPVIRRGR